ncbi:hypothetical protein [Bradyrhizobium lablabi]|uniref:hypothetical protein n=1 Tax=Bradyrhizobium lablabi TaxID=722472 RepID=UPI0012AB4FB3|nr:hypothetical protein [Bradyrhizobium lablabi]
MPPEELLQCMRWIDYIHPVDAECVGADASRSGYLQRAAIFSPMRPAQKNAAPVRRGD